MSVLQIDLLHIYLDVIQDSDFFFNEIVEIKLTYFFLKNDNSFFKIRYFKYHVPIKKILENKFLELFLKGKKYFFLNQKIQTSLLDVIPKFSSCLLDGYRV